MGSPRLTSSCRGELRGNGGSGCNQTLLGFALEPEQLRAWIFPLRLRPLMQSKKSSEVITGLTG